MPLAVALGIAVGLVIAAGLVRMMSGDDRADVVDVQASAGPQVLQSEGVTGVVDPLSAAAGAGIAAGSPVEQAPAAPPGRLSVPGEEVVVTPDAPAALWLTNSGGAELAWRVASHPSWVTMDRLEGTVGPAARVEVQVSHVEGLAEGDYAGEVLIEWGEDREVAAVQLLGAVERLPDLQNLQVGSRSLVGRGCGFDQTEVAVAVADESPVGLVLITATGPGTDTQTQFPLDPDPQVPGRFIGIVGPFDVPGTITLDVEATDSRGNRVAAQAGELVVSPCPGG